MTNEEKYKTVEERVRAFDSFCSSDCRTCPVDKMNTDESFYHCMAYWLALEAEEEKPEPCPFCGGKCHTHTELGTDPSKSIENGDTPTKIFCSSCDYTSKEFDTKAAAIAAHNRVARAVRKAKESEVK